MTTHRIFVHIDPLLTGVLVTALILVGLRLVVSIVNDVWRKG